MRSIISYLLFSCCAFALWAHASQDEFYNDLLISAEQKQEDSIIKASASARDLLQQKKKNIDISSDRKLQEILKKQQKEHKPQKTQKFTHARLDKLSPAPFGLLWGETYQETLSSGVLLTATQEKDYVNSFIATQLPKPLKDIREVIVTFGEDNRLWRIISYGNFIKDTPDAALVLREYHRFYDMLKQKYGNAEENYTPKITEITKTVDLGYGKTKEEKEKIKEPIGNPNFLAQLQSGEADLYATFYNREVGVGLSINVDGSGQSYLILEYKNLNLFKQQQDETIDAL